MRSKLLKGILPHMYERPQCEECVHPHTSIVHACTDKQGCTYIYECVFIYSMYVLYVQITSICWTIFRVHSGEHIHDLTQLQFLVILFKHDKQKKKKKLNWVLSDKHFTMFNLT